MKDTNKFYGNLISQHKNQNEDLREQNDILRAKLKLEKIFSAVFATITTVLLLINIFN